MLEKIVQVFPAYDKRNPDPNKNYGIGSVHIKFILKGKLGAVQFLILTGWYLSNVVQEYEFDSWKNWQPMGADIGYHSPKQLYAGQICIDDNCEYLNGKPCYYGGSGLYAEKVFNRMLLEGDKAIWEELEDYYLSTFDDLE